MYRAQIEKAINSGNNDGFTTPLKGELKRYVVAFTNNNGVYNIDTLDGQATALAYINSNINVGGWIDGISGDKYIDISTSVDNLDEALTLARTCKQIAIWDGVEQEEIRIEN